MVLQQVICEVIHEADLRASGEVDLHGNIAASAAIQRNKYNIYCHYMHTNNAALFELKH
jgi:glycine betaine/choline ABC-type transport system substrate-binding protein